MIPPPRQRTTMEASKGATLPSLKELTRKLPTRPLAMAASPLPRKTALEKISESQAPSYPLLKCSPTSQDSKVEKRREVAIPPRSRPTMRTW